MSSDKYNNLSYLSHHHHQQQQQQQSIHAHPNPNIHPNNGLPNTQQQQQQQRQHVQPSYHQHSFLHDSIDLGNGVNQHISSVSAMSNPPNSTFSYHASHAVPMDYSTHISGHVSNGTSRPSSTSPSNRKKSARKTSVTSEGDEDEKIKRRRERERESAKRCRERKRAKIEDLQQQVEDLRRENEELRRSAQLQQIEGLFKERYAITGALESLIALPTKNSAEDVSSKLHSLFANYQSMQEIMENQFSLLPIFVDLACFRDIVLWLLNSPFDSFLADAPTTSSSSSSSLSPENSSHSSEQPGPASSPSTDIEIKTEDGALSSLLSFMDNDDADQKSSVDVESEGGDTTQSDRTTQREELMTGGDPTSTTETKYRYRTDSQGKPLRLVSDADFRQGMNDETVKRVQQKFFQDLKLKNEQVQALVSFRKKWFDEVQKAFKCNNRVLYHFTALAAEAEHMEPWFKVRKEVMVDFTNLLDQNQQAKLHIWLNRNKQLLQFIAEHRKP